MKAYSKGITKTQFVKEMKLHAKLDNFLKGTYNKGEKGCAVGCSIKSINKLRNITVDCSSHKAYETYLGIPEWLALLEDRLFERVSLEYSKSWPVRFSEAVNTGADLDKIKIPFIVYILKQNIKVQTKQLKQNLPENIKEIIKEVIKVNKQMIKAQKTQDKEKIDMIESAARYAEAAAISVWSAARDAEFAAKAAESAEYAAMSVVESAWYNWSAEFAFRYAAWSAESAAESAWSAAKYARSAEPATKYVYENYAEELLRLMKECV
jgi:hypothetical protein